jgi:hypothetical protein
MPKVHDSFFPCGVGQLDRRRSRHWSRSATTARCAPSICAWSRPAKPRSSPSLPPCASFWSSSTPSSGTASHGAHHSQLDFPRHSLTPFALTPYEPLTLLLPGRDSYFVDAIIVVTSDSQTCNNIIIERKKRRAITRSIILSHRLCPRHSHSRMPRARTTMNVIHKENNPQELDKPKMQRCFPSACRQSEMH